MLDDNNHIHMKENAKSNKLTNKLTQSNSTLLFDSILVRKMPVRFIIVTTFQDASYN